MNTTGKKATKAAMFNAIGGWTTQFEIEGQKVGGEVEILPKDPRLIWHLEQVGGAEGKMILELGPLEGAHTKMLIEAGAREVIAVEGLSDAFLRCLVVKEAFQLKNAQFFFADFNDYVADYKGEKFDFVSATGVLYHQNNPAKLIFDLAKITDTVLVWSQVANETKPAGPEKRIYNGLKPYLGKVNNYGSARKTSDSYCGGLNEQAFWFYPSDLRACFYDAGFTRIIEQPQPPNINGDAVLFVAKR